MKEKQNIDFAYIYLQIYKKQLSTMNSCFEMYFKEISVSYATKSVSAISDKLFVVLIYLIS